jgi:hypothetical protein
MRNRFLLYLLPVSLLFSQCSKDKQEDAAPIINYDQASIALMEKLAPQVVGDWELRQVNVKIQSHNWGQKQLGLTRDTVFQNLATMTIRTAAVPRANPRDARYPDFEGSITYKSKTYPIYFKLMANAEYIIRDQGPQAFFLLEYNFPVGTRLREPQEIFLDNLGLTGDNYSLELVAGQLRMTWRGLNRGVEKIELHKR